MTDIVAISKKGAKVFPQTHYLAILELDKHVKSLIPDQVDTSSFVTSGSMSEYVLNQLKSYALANDIPDVSNLITASALAPYATTADLNAAIAKVSTVKGDTGPLSSVQLKDATTGAIYLLTVDDGEIKIMKEGIMDGGKTSN